MNLKQFHTLVFDLTQIAPILIAIPLSWFVILGILELYKEASVAVFKKTNSLFGMTAHIVYRSFDPNFVATHSKIIINKIIRKYIGFKGVIISDDLSMKALRYGLKENAIRALNAGCNLVLHCNGKYKEMLDVAENSPKVDEFIIKKTSQLINIIR